MSTNNYVSNENVRLPTRVKRALNDLVVKYELEAAQVAAGIEVNSETGNLFKELLTSVERVQPHRFESIKAQMVSPLESAAYKFDSHYEVFGNLDFNKGDVLENVDLVAKHVDVVSSLGESWINIPPVVLGAGEFDFRHLHDSELVFPQKEYRGLKFYLDKVHCLDETGRGGRWGGERWGEDEIHCAAVAVDETGQTTPSDLFKVGYFDDGDVRSYRYPGKELEYFNLREGGDTFPKIYTMGICLIEKDFGDLPAWFSKFLEIVKKEVAKYVAELVGVAVGSIIGSSIGPLGTLIGAAIGWALGKLVGLVKRWLRNDNMGLQTVMATINGYSGNWMGSGSSLSNTFTRDYKAHRGHYRIHYRWELV